MSLACSEQEMQCVAHWFTGWSPFQKEEFLKDLVEKAVPHNVDNLFDAMNTLNVSDKPPNIYKCQMKLFDQWFTGWQEKERNDFLIKLGQIDPDFVSRLNQTVAQASGGR